MVSSRILCAALLCAALLLQPVSASAEAPGASPAVSAASAVPETPPASAAAAKAPDGALNLTAPSAVLMEASTGTVLYEKNDHARLPPASVTKIMTLLLVLEALDSGRISWDDSVTASEAAAAKGGSQVFLEAGEQMPLRDMLKSVVVSSANDCAAALAEHVAGSEAAFVAQMNARAAALGMTDTHFVNCTGLDDEPDAGEHLTTAYDIALMSRALLQHPEIRQYTTIWMDTVRDGRFGLSNTNKLVRFYPGTTGLKTGFTGTAGYCLSASAARDGVEFIAVALHCDTADHRNADCRAMLDYAFANYALFSPVPDEALPEVAVRLGQTGSVAVVPAQAGGVLIGKGEAAAAERTVRLPAEIEAPVAEGQPLGSITVASGGTVLAEIPLLAAAAVPRLTFREAALRIFRGVCFAGSP